MTQQAPGWVPDPSSDFGARLALVRQHMAWNGKQAADACGIDPQSWRSWETAGRRPRDYAKVCQRISEASGVSVIWLMTGQMPGGEWLPRRDSNLEPSDYRTTDSGISMWGLAA